MLLLVNNVAEKMRRRKMRRHNTISFYKFTKVLLLFIYFKFVMKLMKFCIFQKIFLVSKKLKTNLKQINIKRTLVIQ